ncbi:hypothetical protein LRY58_00395 [Candidatus Woesebacteria bacterium]|nr:hypothetical protein [Candidatus Woesebacteria bacterium]
MVTTLAQERVTGIPDTLKEVLSKFGSASLEALMLSGIDVGKTLLLKNFAEGDSKHYFFSGKAPLC